MSDHSSAVHSLRFKNGFTFHGPLECIIPAELRKRENISALTLPQPDTDPYWMLEALRESMKNAGLTNPNPAVGCILIDRNGRELARGTTQAFPGQHAERVAFSQLNHPQLLSQGTAYLTLEPCTHYGNQPPCIDLLINSPVKRVIIARSDSDPRVSRRGIQQLQTAGKHVEVGLFQHETTAWNFAFFAGLELKRPVFTLKWAQTLDGQLADDTHSSKWISGESSRAYTHWMRQRHDGILVGAQTFIQDQPQLDVRSCALRSNHHPSPIIWDLKGRLLLLPPQQQESLLKRLSSQNRKILYITSKTQQKLLSHSIVSQKENILTLELTPLSDPRKNPINSELIEKLASPEVQAFLGKKLQSIFIEGGAQTLQSFIDAGYADSVHTFIAPMITGGKSHRISLLKTLNEAPNFAMMGCHQLGKDTLIEMVSHPLYRKLFHSSDSKT